MSWVLTICEMLEDYFVVLFENMNPLWMAIFVWTIFGVILVAVSQIRLKYGEYLLNKERYLRAVYVGARVETGRRRVREKRKISVRLGLVGKYFSRSGRAQQKRKERSLMGAIVLRISNWSR